MTVLEYGNAWLARVPPDARRFKAIAFRAWVAPYLGGRAVSSLVPEDVDELRYRLLEAGYSASTTRQSEMTLGALWRAAYLDGETSVPWPAGERLAHEERRPLPAATAPPALPVLPAAETPTLAAYAEHWFQGASAPPYVATYTAQLRRYRLARYVFPHLGERPLGSITRADVQALQGRLFARGYAYATVRGTIVGMLGPLLAEARRDGLITEIPTRGLRWPREPQRAPDPYLPAEVERILGWFQRREPQWVPFIALVFLAGMRPSEAVALRWGDLDLERRSVSVTKARVNGEEKETKTRRSVRTIYLSKRLVKLLIDYKADRAQPGDLIATRKDGQPVKAQVFGGHEMRRCTDELGIRRRGLYAGRRYLISQSITKGANPAHVAAYTGTSLVILERHYLRYLAPLEAPLRDTRKPRVTKRRDHAAH